MTEVGAGVQATHGLPAQRRTRVAPRSRRLGHCGHGAARGVGDHGRHPRRYPRQQRCTRARPRRPRRGARRWPVGRRRLGGHRRGVLRLLLHPAVLLVHDQQPRRRRDDHLPPRGRDRRRGARTADPAQPTAGSSEQATGRTDPPVRRDRSRRRPGGPADHGRRTRDHRGPRHAAARASSGRPSRRCWRAWDTERSASRRPIRPGGFPWDPTTSSSCRSGARACQWGVSSSSSRPERTSSRFRPTTAGSRSRWRTNSAWR